VAIVAKGVPGYFKDGSVYNGPSHKMPNGDIHSGKTHTQGSKKLFHLNELSKTTQKKLFSKKK